MKLLIITRFFPKDYLGGGEEVVYNIWKNAKKHYDVSLISGWVNDPKLLPEDTHTIDLRSKNRFIRYLKLYFGVKKYIKITKPDVIHTNTMEIPETSTPTVVMVHHLGHFFGKSHEKSMLSKLRLKMQKSLVKKRLNRAKQIVTVSKATRDDVIKLGINPEKIEVIYNGIDVDKLKPKETNNKKFTIVLPSRISREKGQNIAIDAIKLMPDDIKKKLELVIVGFVSDERYLNELKDKAKNLPITIEANVPDIVKYYQKADLIVFPTLMYEGFGLVAAEAMCCEKPVIASNFPAIKEVVNENGILVNPNDSKELSEAIVKLFKNKSMRDKFSKQGRKFVLNNFTWDIAFKKYKKIYDKLGVK
ncbi:glycosyltransferase family 4 protein [Nanoarchaeota archaeon]